MCRANKTRVTVRGAQTTAKDALKVHSQYDSVTLELEEKCRISLICVKPSTKRGNDL